MRVRTPLLLLALSIPLLAVRCAPGLGYVPVFEALRCPIMPQDSYWHADVRDLPVHPRSDDWVERIGDDEPLRAGFGSGVDGPSGAGIPFTVVPFDQAMVPVSFRFFLDSDPGPYPVPMDAPVEGGELSDGDRRVIVLQEGTCRLYEMFDAHAQGDGSWEAGTGAVFDLESNAMRPEGDLSADDAGLPILPALVRYEEAALGLVGHALRFTAPNTRGEALWPARSFTSSAGNPNLPPMGAWFRLEADVDPAAFSPAVRPIVEALQRHGMILADAGDPWTISGVPSEHWDDAALLELGVLTGEDFEAVDVSSLIVDADSGEVASPPE